MKKTISLLALAAVASAAAAASASAADLAPPPPPAPAPEIRSSIADWTGPYVGAVVGGTCMDTDFSTTTTYQVSDAANGEVNPAPTSSDPALNGCGVSGGFVYGFNYQFDRAVVGLEGDFTWGGRTGDHHDTTSAGDKIGEYYNVKWQTSVRARVGWLSNDDTLFYITGGPSWMRGEMEDILTGQKDANTHFGYVIGGGIEHAVTENIHLRAEYLFSAYKAKTYGPYTCNECVTDVANGDTTNESSTTTAREEMNAFHTFRVGLTWNFPVSTW